MNEVLFPVFFLQNKFHILEKEKKVCLIFQSKISEPLPLCYSEFLQVIGSPCDSCFFPGYPQSSLKNKRVAKS